MGSMPTMEYYSALRRKETLTPATTWMSLEDMMLSELKDKHVGIPLTWSPPRSQIQGGRKYKAGYPGLEEGDGALVFKGARISVWEDGKFWT